MSFARRVLSVVKVATAPPPNTFSGVPLYLVTHMLAGYCERKLNQDRNQQLKARLNKTLKAMALQAVNADVSPIHSIVDYYCSLIAFPDEGTYQPFRNPWLFINSTSSTSFLQFNLRTLLALGHKTNGLQVVTGIMQLTRDDPSLLTTLIPFETMSNINTPYMLFIIAATIIMFQEAYRNTGNTKTLTPDMITSWLTDALNTLGTNPEHQSPATDVLDQLQKETEEKKA